MGVGSSMSVDVAALQDISRSSVGRQLSRQERDSSAPPVPVQQRRTIESHHEKVKELARRRVRVRVRVLVLVVILPSCFCFLFLFLFVSSHTE